MAKKPKTPKKSNQLNTVYEKDGEAVKKKNSFCPKCGEGVFMAKHKDRSSCGKCGYTEFSKN